MVQILKNVSAVIRADGEGVAVTFLLPKRLALILAAFLPGVVRELTGDTSPSDAMDDFCKALKDEAMR